MFNWFVKETETERLLARVDRIEKILKYMDCEEETIAKQGIEKHLGGDFDLYRTRIWDQSNGGRYVSGYYDVRTADESYDSGEFKYPLDAYEKAMRDKGKAKVFCKSKGLRASK